jgi:hypothetical protein
MAGLQNIVVEVMELVRSIQTKEPATGIGD